MSQSSESKHNESASASASASAFGNVRYRKIDVHTHILPEHMPDWAKRFGYGDFIRLDHHCDCRVRIFYIYFYVPFLLLEIGRAHV